MICRAQRKVVFKQETRKKQFSFHNFLVLVCSRSASTINRLIFLVVVQHPHVSCALRCLSSMFNTEIASTNSTSRKTFTFPGFLNEFEFVTLRIVEFHTIFLVVRRSWLWIGHYHFCNVSIIFTVPSLLGNNQEIGLKWKKIRCRLGGMNIEQKIWKS